MNMPHFLILPLVEALSVVVTTAVMYAVLAAVLRRCGQRLFATTSATTVAMASVLGAIVGRTSLGLHPDLEGGLLALGTLLLLERAFGRLLGGSRTSSHQATALLVDGHVDAAALRRVGLTEHDLWARLRVKGVGDSAAVALAVLERDGQISVLRGPITREAVVDVRGGRGTPRAAFGEGPHEAGPPGSTVSPR